MPLPPRAILFDLDGTLADSAPDLAAAANRMRALRSLPALPYALLRPHASSGARGLLGAAFDLRPADAGYEAMKAEFLSLYAEALCVHSSLFDGVPALLSTLSESGIVWGVVTNKAERLARPLMAALALEGACLVGGDTTPHTKPHPAPLLEAATRIGIAPADCWYVGDDKRDIDAGRAAGMQTVAAAWGYCGLQEPASWNADLLAESPAAMLALLRA